MVRTARRQYSHRTLAVTLLLLMVGGLLFASDSFAQLQNEQTQSVDEYLVMNNPKIKNTIYNIGNITVGDPNVVNFKADRKKNRITLFPKNPGTTSMIIFDQKGGQKEVLSLVVYSTDPERLEQDVKQLLVDIEGITIKRVGQKIIIDGSVLLPSELSRIQKVTDNTNLIVSLVTMNPDTERLLAKRISKEIGMDEVNVRSVKGKILLEGEVYSPESKIKAEKIASLYATNIINALEVRSVSNPPIRKDTIQVTAHFVEVAKNFSKNFNFKWSPIPQVGVNASYRINPVSGSDSFTGALTGTATDILPKLNYFKALGIARVLENPTVSVKSGDTATIESGTQIGFPVIQPNGSAAMEFKDVGAMLKIKPYAQGSDIDLEIQVEMSSLGSPEVDGGVAISRNSIQTTQLVRSGESVVIGGLIRNSYRQSLDRPPPNSGTSSSSTPSASQDTFVDPFPMGSLFTLFKSTDESKRRSQFMIFITPSILKFSKDANKELKDSFNLYEVYPN
jgi:Flp pilus assembly secretin CpaC